MSCPTELELSMHVDGALAADEDVRVGMHAAGCERCGPALHALRNEAACLKAALDIDDERVSVPTFAHPVSSRAIAASGAALLAATAALTAAPAVLVLALPRELAWIEAISTRLNPFEVARLPETVVRSLLFIARNGDAIMNSLITTAVALVIAALIAWGAVSFRRGVGVALVIAAMLAMGTLSPVPADALEIRQAAEGDVLRIAAGETIDDTLIALADTVEIDGIVEGDLIAVGRVVVIRGRVAGQLVAIAQSVTVSGVVEGSVLGLGQTVNVSAEQIGRNLFGFGSTVSTASATRVGQNAVVAGRVHLAGTVDRDVVGFGQDLEIGSAIGGDLTAWASSVTLLSSASVGGNFSAHVPEETAVSISPEATVAGEQTIDIEERAEDQSEYGTIGFYFRQLLRFAAAFITGLILLALVPRLQRVGPTSALDGLIACGIGLIALAAVPVIAVIAAITVIGIPMALLTVMLYVVGVYLAKIVVAHFIGRTLIARNGTARPFAAALAVGLVLVLVVVNLPFVGGWLNFILTIGGLGLIVRFVWDRARGAPAYA